LTFSVFAANYLHLDSGDPMNILFAASEAVPFAKTGGLADVAGSLPRALSETESVSLFIPEYDNDVIGNLRLQRADDFEVRIGANTYPALIKTCQLERNFRLFLVGQDLFFARKFLYGSAAGDYPDNFHRFLFFQKAVVEFVNRRQLAFDIFHAHDWQAALIPLLIRLDPFQKRFAKTRTVFSLHNLGYQGIFPANYFTDMGVPEYLFSSEYLEFFGAVNFLKAGIVFADSLVTVSPTYSREILTPAMGFGLDGILRKYSHKLMGILNGFDDSLWNPQTDRQIYKNYDADSVEKKSFNKVKLFRELAIKADSAAPLVIIISRLEKQKGIELLLAALPDLLATNLVFVVLGTGDRILTDKLSAAAASAAGKMVFLNRFDEPLSHRLQAAGDMLLMPSLYEPCGLNQLYGLKYGTVPIVRATGGLADTVKNFDAASGSGNGFTFTNASTAELSDALHRARKDFSDPAIWRSIQRNGMSMDFSWGKTAQDYRVLYQNLLHKEKKNGGNHRGQ